MTFDNGLTLVQALGLGLGLALMLWRLREARPSRCGQISAIGLVLLGAGYLCARPDAEAPLERLSPALEARMQHSAQQVAASEAARLSTERPMQEIALLYRIQRFFGMRD